MKNSHRRANVLVDIIQNNDIKIIAEIGVDKCTVLKKVLEDCGHFIEQYWAIDPWTSWDSTEKFQKRTNEEWNTIYADACKMTRFFPQLHVLKLTSSKASELLPRKYFDLVFIDADHRYESVRNDIKNWLPLIKSNGFLTGHDYGHPNFPGVKKSVDEYFGDSIMIRGDRVWIKEVV